MIEKNNTSTSIGVVSSFDLLLKNPFKLTNGKELKDVNIRYETYGKLNEDKTNVILVFHGISGNHHAAGCYKPDKPDKDDKEYGWWESLIGQNKAIDTDKYFVICANCLGGCSGTTGPSSINPLTGTPYNLEFPFITIADMVHLQIELINHFGIKKLAAAIGSSMGGMKAMYLANYFPELVEKVIIIASTTAQGTQSLAFSEVSRQAIMRDPNWDGGNYLSNGKHKSPESGLAIARMLSHITYLSNESINKKFGRKLQNKETYDFTFDVEFAVESYLRYKGNSFVTRFDSNSYLYISKALNYFDLREGGKNLEDVFQNSLCEYLIISFTSDWAYPPEMSREIIRAIYAAGKKGSYVNIETDKGHDAFLLETEKLTKVIQPFLS